MARHSRHVSGGGFVGFGPPDITNDAWEKIEQATNVQFSPRNRARIGDVCCEYMNQQSANESMAQPAKVRETLEFLDEHFARLIMWWRSPNDGDRRGQNARQAVEEVIRRPFMASFGNPRERAEIESRRFRYFFDEMAAQMASMRREIALDIQAFKKGTHPLIEEQQSAWDQWVRGIDGVVKQLSLSPRRGTKGRFAKSQIIALIEQLQPFVRAPVRYERSALAKAILRALRTNKTTK
jgi:hypothetical protein